MKALRTIFLLDTGAELSVVPNTLLSSLSLNCSGHTPHTHSVQGLAGRDIVIKGPYSLLVVVCGVKFIHPFYTLDSPAPCVAGYDLVCAAKLVIDQVRHMDWSYWHVDLYATPAPRILHTPRTMSADAQPTTSVRTTARIPHGCHRVLRVDNSTVEPASNESLQRPRAPMSPRAHFSSPHSDSSSSLTRSQSLGTPLRSQSPRAPSASQDAQVFQQSDTPCDSTIFQVVTNTAAASVDPPDPITSEVPEHLQELFQSTVQDNNLSSSLASELKDLFVEHKDTFATGPTDIGY